MNFLNSKSKDYISRKIGMTFEEIVDKDSTDLVNHIEKKLNIKLDHKKSDFFKRTARGTPFIYLWRLMPLKKIEKRLSKI